MKRRHERVRSKRRLATTAGTIAAITLSSACGAQAQVIHVPPLMPNPHLVPVRADRDGDLLSVAEELALGYDPNCADQNVSGISDGQELALVCAALIHRLPEADPNTIDQLHKVSHAMRGLEWCDACGESVNMGSLDIVNPTLNLTISLPFIGLHHMEHGSFSYAGDLHAGRLDVPCLVRTLALHFPEDPNEHLLPVREIDLDGDSLTDQEELALGLNLYSSDQNHNLMTDGLELARACAAAIEALPTKDPSDPAPTTPYKVVAAMYGLEDCQICGHTTNMGYYDIVNPELNQSIHVPLMACHALSHGSFTYSGTENQGRIVIESLLKILELFDSCAGLKPQMDVNDL